ncbi:DNA-processing protein DprA [Desulfotruncus alcoholivorax]|uniref:DNA-processing protein DprA n=1 Tax=Desulfotruncus alcoholivorax TaxID=265477 RepID=UPI0003F88D5E|nr:DNA-processing protein DprA [Desulfotruncus alcoholivorax]
MEERVFWLAWHYILAGQAQRFWEIINYFESPKEAWFAAEKDFMFLKGMHRRDASNLLLRRQQTDLSEVASWLMDSRFGVLLFNDSQYPEQLKNIYDPPPALYVRGDSELLAKISVAMVGSRRATHYGLNVAEKLARELAKAEITVISGMARGVDTAAHRGAINSGGATIAVLGCGVDVVYPRENEKLMYSIIDNGAVVSEFPPGSPPEAWHFPVRNRIISGLSKAVVVVEAAERSGALITAHVALDQGREVMAVPGNITNKYSKGPNNLIKQGAAPVTGAGDILEGLGVGLLFTPDAGGVEKSLSLSANESKIFSLIEYEPVSLEILVQKSGLPPGEVMTGLMFLEIKGCVKQMPGKLYYRTGR